jgi:GntR family transcriptional regulator
MPDSAFARLPDGAGAPLYEVVKREVAEAILLGAWAPGSVIPSENALAADFGVSVGTVRKALGELVAEGMLMRRRKTGTVVTGWAPLHNLRYFFQYFRLHTKNGTLLRTKVRMISYEAGFATDHEAQRLAIAAGADVIRLARLRMDGERPAMYENLVLPKDRFPDFPDESELPDLLYRFLLEKYGVRITAVREQLTTALATDDDCEKLQLTPPYPILVIDRLSFDNQAHPVIMSSHRSSTEHYMYVNEVR